MTSHSGRYDASLAARHALTALAPYSAGRDAAAVQRDTGFTGTVVKLASNEGAEGPFPSALAAMQSSMAELHRYPPAGAAPLVAALAGFHRVPESEVLVTGGGCAALAHLSSALLEPGDEVVLGNPTFHLYRLETLRMGARPVLVPLTADGRYDLEAMQAAVTPRTRLVYVCTPNNPTGGLVDGSALTRFLEALPPRVLPIIDEAYFEYVDSPEHPDPARVRRVTARPVVVIRTFSKIYGLAGLRVGYAIAPPQIVAACRKVQNPYEVGRVAQAAAVASLASPDELERRLHANRALRSRLVDGLVALGLAPLPSQANFACVRVGAARALTAALERRGFVVRPLDAMGDPGSIRITVGTRDEIDAFLPALAAELADADLVDRGSMQ